MMILVIRCPTLVEDMENRTLLLIKAYTDIYVNTQQICLTQFIDTPSGI